MLLFHILLVLLAFSDKCLAYCPQGWNSSDTGCYFVSDEPATFEDNYALCQSMGSSMLSITSQEQNAFFESILEYTAEYYWLASVTNLTANGLDYKWADGSALRYANWAFGEPNCKPGKLGWVWSGIGDCCAIAWGATEWRDEACSSRYYQVCYKPTGNGDVPNGGSKLFTTSTLLILAAFSLSDMY